MKQHSLTIEFTTEERRNALQAISFANQAAWNLSSGTELAPPCDGRYSKEERFQMAIAKAAAATLDSLKERIRRAGDSAVAVTENEAAALAQALYGAGDDQLARKIEAV